VRQKKKGNEIVEPAPTSRHIRKMKMARSFGGNCPCEEEREEEEKK
jgi:hypothetical protein